MYTVMLADDETATLHFLHNSIRWQELGVGNVLMVPDGIHALEEMEKQPVDLLITDIMMPRLDGLNLIKTVRNLYPDTHCILLTAYSEFEYAKQAIQLGVENYLVKPVSQKELSDTVEKALDNIYKSRAVSDTLLANNTILRWLGGHISSEELGERALFLGLNLYYPSYCVVCIKKKTEGSTALFRAKCIEALETEHSVYHIWDEKGRFVFILGSANIDAEKLAIIFRKAIRDMSMDDRVLLAIGCQVQETDTLHMSYQVACDLIEISNPPSTETILTSASSLPDLYGDALSEELKALLYEESAEKRQILCQNLLIKYWQGETVFRSAKDIDTLRKACIRSLVSEFPDLPAVRDHFVYQVHSHTSQPVEKAEIDARAFIEHVYQAFQTQLACFSPIITRALLYIRTRRNFRISIKDFCARNRMNASYMGYLFKHETGMFFNDYVIRYRVNQSIIQLLEPERRIKDIAESTGFSTTSYFAQCFKKQKGISPGDYRAAVALHKGDF